ncbi:hypothetical protein [Providencia burhodogranariea]|uniref:Transketolase n=1 Tax=Providencia burhodogranariea DSM 19968 TaxID=1141662 RepID=K8X1V9_9GAMM|nr:hypothetical protein [Providencia burhodogranariea]EKT62450.1 transketolase [Providencia burhodogranariea DSM 19968]
MSTQKYNRLAYTTRILSIDIAEVPCGKYVGLDGLFIGISSFRESAASQLLFKHFGFIVNNLINMHLSLDHSEK